MKSKMWVNGTETHLFVVRIDFRAGFMPLYEMAERHIEPYLSVCVYLFDCALQNRVRFVASPYIVRFENNMAQIIFMTRWCVACKKHVTRSNAKVTVCSVT